MAILKPGMKVLIDSKCKKTDKKFTVVREMEHLLGSVQILGRVFKGSYPRSIKIRGFLWHCDDITPVKEEIVKKEIKAECFNIENLNL